MPPVRSSLRVAAAAALLAVPAVAAAQVPEVPTSGTGTGYTWTTFPLGPTNSPSAVGSAFGQVWLPDAKTGSGQLSAVDPSTGSVTAQYSPAGAPRVSAALTQGNFLWLAGPRSAGARVIAVDQTGVTQRTFNGPAKSGGWSSPGYGGVSLAYGAGAIWVSDQAANRVYAISPTTAKLVRTITVKAPRSVAVSGNTVWVTNAAGLKVSMFSAKTGQQLATGSAKTDPSVMAAANGTMWVFGENVITGFSLKTLKRTTTVAIPTIFGSGWAGVVNVAGQLWVSNYVAGVMAFNPSTRTITTSGGWSNSDFGGGITSANGSLWVADSSSYAFPLGFGVTRITPTATPAP